MPLLHRYQADIDREFSHANLGLKTFPTIVYFPKVGCLAGSGAGWM